MHSSCVDKPQRSQNFSSLSLEIPLQRRQGRPELSHLHHQAISTPPSPSGTTFQPFLAYSRHLVQINSTGIGFTAPGELPYSPTRAADAGPNPHLLRIRPHLPHQHLEVRPAKTVLSRPLGRGDGQRHGHWLCGFSPCCPTHHAPKKCHPHELPATNKRPQINSMMPIDLI